MKIEPIATSQQKRACCRAFSAATQLGHNVIAHNSVRSKRSAVNEANKTVNVVKTTADDVHQNASRVRIVNQTPMMTVCQLSSRQHVYALANLRPWTWPKANVRGSCKGRVSQLNHFDVQVQAYVRYREVKTWHIRVCFWCELEFITDSTYYELVTREDCITAVNRHTAKLPSNKGLMDFTPCKDWVDTILNVENNGALISSDFRPFKIGRAPTIFAGPGWATYHQQVNLIAICTEITYNRALGTVASGQHSLTGCLYEDEFCISGNYMYVWNARMLDVRCEQIVVGTMLSKRRHMHTVAPDLNELTNSPYK